ncbi:MAG: HDOD domain-containing protein [Verrucomicrobiota bacterium]|nr:HDOD domain-containing protein [Verrucomicrobiota bacterium]
MNQVLKGFTEAPPDFALLAELWPIAQAPNSGLNDLANLIEESATLSAALIRVSNSAYYGSTTQIDTLAGALRRLGFNETIKVAALSTHRSFLQESLEVYGTTVEEVFDEALAVGLLMEFLAHEADVDPATAYVCGLVHGIGRFPVARLLSKIKPNARAPQVMDFTRLARWEREEIGFDHAKLGGLMLDQWGFPSNIVETVGSHLHPGLGAANKRLSSLLFVCRRLLPCVLHPAHYTLDQIDLPLTTLNFANTRRMDISACLPSVIAWHKNTRAIVEAEVLSA